MIFHVLPKWFPFAGITLATVVFVKKGCKPLLVEHELVHARQQREDGVIRYCWRYLFKSWRVKYEAEAYAVQVRGGEETLDWCARELSGRAYLYPCTFNEAWEAIKARL